MANAAPERGEAPSERLPFSVMLAYGAPGFAGAAMAIPIAVNMPKFYSDVVMVPLGYIAIAIALARAFDAITDPAMGWLSDRTRSRFGRRRPWIVVGVVPCAFAFYALFSPPQWLTPGWAGVWFGVCFLLYFLFHTIYIIPHAALGVELTQDYHERSRIFAVREAFVIPGTLIAAILPSVATSQFYDGDERAATSAIALFYAVLLVALYLNLVMRVREREEFAKRAPNPLAPGVRRALRSRPFTLLLITFFIGSIPAAIPGTLVPFFSAYVIGVENEIAWRALPLGAYFGSGFVVLPFWVWAARRFGKKRTWLASFLVGISGGVALFGLGEGDRWPFVALLAWTGSAFGAGLFLIPSIKGDVIDYDELLTGRRREAQYTALWAIIPKLVAIPSATLPLVVIDAIGYVPNQAQSPEVVTALRVMFCLFPALCSSVALLVALRFPIEERIHRATLRAIEAHKRGETVEDPVSGLPLPPPSHRSVDEETSWFLDHFSAGELASVLRRGSRRLLGVVLLKASIAFVCTAVAGYGALRSFGLANDEKLASLSLVLVASGGLTVLFFQLLKLGPARRFGRRPVDSALIKAHLLEVAASRGSRLAAPRAGAA